MQNIDGELNIRNYIFVFLDRTEQAIARTIEPKELLLDVKLEMNQRLYTLGLFQMNDEEIELMYNKLEDQGILFCKLVD